MPVGTLLSRSRFAVAALALLAFALCATPVAARAALAPPRTLLDDGDWSLLVPQSTPDPQEAQAGIFDAPRNRLLIFGGWDGTNSLNSTRELTIGTPPVWNLVTTLGSTPAGRYAHSVVYDSARDRILVFGGRNATSSYFGDVWALSLSGPPTWTEIVPSGTPPSGRFGHEAIYDPVRDRMLVFGGYDGAFRNDLWELSLGGTPTWTNLTPAGTPPTERDFATSVYDPVGDRLVLYGGNVFISPGPAAPSGDVWTLSLSGTPTWAPLAVAGSPPVSRLLHKSFYDAPRNRLIVMGGYDGFNFRNDAYALSLGGVPEWTNLFPFGPLPARRSGHTFVYDSVHDLGLLFGGRNGGGFLGDAFSLSLTGPVRWTRLQTVPKGAPGRLLHKAAYDPLRKQMLVFGGYSYADGWLNDTWGLGLSGTPAWSRPDLASALHPVPRSDHVLIADPPADRLVLFGGRDLNNFYNDTWTFELATGKWLPLSPAGTPPTPREAMAGVFDPVRDRLLVFGGWNGGASLSELWSLSLGPTPTWTMLTPLGSPPQARYAHSMVYDPVRDRMLVFGGFNGFSRFNNVWALNLSGTPTWVLLTPAGSPPNPLTGHDAIYDPIRDRMLVFGGYDGGVHNWVYALALAPATPAWSALSPTGGPPKARDFSFSTYDPVLDRLVMFGGNTGSIAFEDTWALNWNQVPTPTLLSFADEQTAPGAVTLTWFTPDGPGQQANAYRRSEGMDWQALAPIESDASGRFVLEDRIAAGGRYAYRLGILGAGGETFTEEHWVQVPGTIAFGLAGVWPNPSPGRLQVSFRLVDARPAALDLLDVRGRRVLHRDLAAFGPGEHAVELDRQGDLAPGVYVIRLSQGDRVERRKIAIVR